MIGLKVNLKNGEIVKNFLLKNNLLATDYYLLKENSYLIFPLRSVTAFDKILKKNKVNFNFELVDLNFQPRRRNYNVFLNELKQKIGSENLKLLRKSFDIIGDILVVEIPKGLEVYEKEIGEFFLKTHPSVKTVLKKKTPHKGVFRVQEYSLLAGVDKRETIYTENGCKFMLDVGKVYFSPRLSSERMRIAKLVKPGEFVLVMFSGYAPYPITILKHSKARVVYGVELNPEAHKYALINKELNKIPDDKLVLIEGDVRQKVQTIVNKLPNSKGGFDRIVMPLPKTGFLFLDVAFKAVVSGGFIHIYLFLTEQEIPDKGFKIIKEQASDFGVKVDFLSYAVCGQVGKRLYRVCFDFKVLK